ncbi:mitochondrial outer membrane translocase complex, subunit Tom22 [Cryomyces antarcticus]
MVKLEEVPDEELDRPQAGPELEDDWDTDTDSDISEDSSDEIPDESLTDRIAALRDVIPPQQRRFLSSTFSSASSWFKTGLGWGGKTLWVVSTSALLLGVPWALAFAEEQQMVEMEREMKMQQSANELLTPGVSSQPAGARPAL